MECLPFPRTPLESSLSNSQHPLLALGATVGPEEMPSEALGSLQPPRPRWGDYVECSEGYQV